MSIDLLTTRQRKVYMLIRDKILNRGYGPTVREIGHHFGISSPNGVMCHLKALEKKGLITREPNMSRAIQLTDAYKEEEGMPLVGLVAAGNLSEAIEQGDRFEFENMFPKRKNQFALKVKGESMIDAQIADGDTSSFVERPALPTRAILWSQSLAKAKQRSSIGSPRQSAIRLQPANSTMKPIYSRDAQVLGVVTGVIRKVA